VLRVLSDAREDFVGGIRSAGILPAVRRASAPPAPMPATMPALLPEVSLWKTALFCTADREYDNRGVGVGGLGFIAVNLTVLGGVEGPVLGV
jgi:hypothetical protein